MPSHGGNQSHHPDSPGRRHSLQPGSLRTKEGIFVGITSGATFAGALKVCGGGGERREHSLHAAGYRRALSQHAAVRRVSGRHERGGTGDLALDAGLRRSVPEAVRNTESAMSVCISARMIAADAAFAAVKDFYSPRATASGGLCPASATSPSAIRTKCRLTASWPRLRERAVPHDKNWFAYKTSEGEPQAFHRRTAEPANWGSLSSRTTSR